MSLFVAFLLPSYGRCLLNPLWYKGFRSLDRQLQELVLPFAKDKRPCFAGRMRPPPQGGGVALALAGWVAMTLGGAQCLPSRTIALRARMVGGYTPSPPLSPAHTPGYRNHNGRSKNFEISKVFFII